MRLPTDSAKTASCIASVWRRQIWLRPLIVLVFLAMVGWGMRARVENTLTSNLHSVLQTTLQSQFEVLHNWMRMQRNQAESAATDKQIAALIRSLLQNVPQQNANL